PPHLVLPGAPLAGRGAAQGRAYGGGGVGLPGGSAAASRERVVADGSRPGAPGPGPRAGSRGHRGSPGKGLGARRREASGLRLLSGAAGPTLRVGAPGPAPGPAFGGYPASA